MKSKSNRVPIGTGSGLMAASRFRVAFALVLALGSALSVLEAGTFSIKYSVEGQRFTYDFGGQRRTSVEFSEVTDRVLVIDDGCCVYQPQFQAYQFFDTCDFGGVEVYPVRSKYSDDGQVL